jgi:hypothetical protein
MVVIEGVTPVDTDSAQEDESDEESLNSVPRPLPEDDIEPWLRASTDDVMSRAEIERFMRVVRHNPNFNYDDVETVIYHLCIHQYFDAHLLPDDDVVPWLYASRYVHIPEPVMDRFVRVLRHNPNFNSRDVHDVIRHAGFYQNGYSADLTRLIYEVESLSQ